MKMEYAMEQEKGCKSVRAKVQRWMDPVSVALNLWASQRIFKAGGGSGFVHFREVFPGVPVDEDWVAIPDPPDYRDYGAMPENERQSVRSDDTYEADPGKYADLPRWDWTTLSACETVEWALNVYDGDSAAMRALLLRIHPDSGRFCPEDYPRDPFVAAARRTLDSGAQWQDVKDMSRISRSAYGAFRRLLWCAIGTPTDQDELGLIVERSRTVDALRRAQRALGMEITERLGDVPETPVVESAS